MLVESLYLLQVCLTWLIHMYVHTICVHRMYYRCAYTCIYTYNVRSIHIQYVSVEQLLENPSSLNSHTTYTMSYIFRPVYILDLIQLLLEVLEREASFEGRISSRNCSAYLCLPTALSQTACSYWLTRVHQPPPPPPRILRSGQEETLYGL